MTDESPRPRLGKGLAALLGEAAEEQSATFASFGGSRRAPIEKLRPNSRNPRRSFSDEDLDELCASIKRKGVLQPIIVRPANDDNFEIVAGERRWRAAQKAGLHEVPIVRIEANDKEALEIAIVENVQRMDLNPLEEAEGYRRLCEEFSYSNAELATMIGKSRSHIANTIRLLNLPEKSKEFLRNGQISAGHARALLAHEQPDDVANQILSKGLSVRDVENLAQKRITRSPAASPPNESKDPDTRALEKTLSDHLGMAVNLRIRKNGGEIVIQFRDLEQLDHIARLLQA